MIRYYLCPIIGDGTPAEYADDPPRIKELLIKHLLDPTSLTPAEAAELVVYTPIQTKPDASFRPPLADLGGVDWVTDVRDRTAINETGPSRGHPIFRHCLVCVNTDAAKHAVIAALDGVDTLLDGELTTEATTAAALARLSRATFASLALGARDRYRAERVKLQQAHATLGRPLSVRSVSENGTLRDWLEGMLQGQHRSTRIKQLTIRTTVGA